MEAPCKTSPASDMPVCRRLRTKMYYVVGRDHVDLRDAGRPPSTGAPDGDVLGPDDVYCSPAVCQPGRACFEPEQ